MKSDHKMTAAAASAAAPEGKGTGKRESKRHNKIIYVVRNAERGQSRQNRKGERGNANARERARANLCRSKTNTKAGTVTTKCTVVPGVKLISQSSDGLSYDQSFRIDDTVW